MKNHVFHVKGMHCKACIVLIEEALAEAPGVVKAKASLKHHQVTITGDFGDQGAEAIMAALAPYSEKHGYALTRDKQKPHVAWKEFIIAIPVALAFLVFFFLLQKTGIVNLVSTDRVNYLTAFIIGVIASVSTCMAIVGGLTLSITANFAKNGDKTVLQSLFHIGRLVSFFLLGGVIGAIGAEFQPGQWGMFTLSIVVGVIMLVLGFNLLDIFPMLKKYQPTLPRFISSHLLEIKKLNHAVKPALLGAVTFFLPCGFTQSMQLYALSTGSFLHGALIMFVFALGTLPVLALLSFAAAGIHSRKMSGVFFKSAGLIVIVFAVLNLTGALAVAGIIPPLVRF